MECRKRGYEYTSVGQRFFKTAYMAVFLYLLIVRYWPIGDLQSYNQGEIWRTTANDPKGTISLTTADALSINVYYLTHKK